MTGTRSQTDHLGRGSLPAAASPPGPCESRSGGSFPSAFGEQPFPLVSAGQALVKVSVAERNPPGLQRHPDESGEVVLRRLAVLGVKLLKHRGELVDEKAERTRRGRAGRWLPFQPLHRAAGAPPKCEQLRAETPEVKAGGKETPRARVESLESEAERLGVSLDRPQCRGALLRRR